MKSSVNAKCGTCRTCHGGENGNGTSSTLALHLAHALKAYGLVDHPVWEEMDGSADLEQTRYHEAESRGSR